MTPIEQFEIKRRFEEMKIMNNFKNLSRDQQKLIEILKPMTPKERYEYQQKCLYEKKDLLLQQIDNYKTKNSFAASYAAEQYIKRTYFEGFNDRYDKEAIRDQSYYGMDIGKMYTFNYPEEGSIEINERKTKVPSERLPYFDTQPIIIYGGWMTYRTTHSDEHTFVKYAGKRPIITAINLKYYPPYVRTLFLNILVEAFKSDIYGEDNYVFGQIVPNTHENFKFYFDLIRMDTQKMGLEYAIRRYYPENMFNIKLVKRRDFAKVAIMDSYNRPFYHHDSSSKGVKQIIKDIGKPAFTWRGDNWRQI